MYSGPDKFSVMLSFYLKKCIYYTGIQIQRRMLLLFRINFISGGKKSIDKRRICGIMDKCDALSHIKYFKKEEK